MAKTITVTVDLEGKAKIEANGFVGKACAKATAEVIAALGGDQDETRKPEWRKDVKQSQQAGA